MLEINGLNIDADGYDIIVKLRDELAVLGINRFNSIRNGVNNVQFSCPIHKEGQERKPSAGMSTVVTYKAGKVIPAGTVHCFTCGYTASLPELVSVLYGKQDGGIWGNRWLKRNYQTVQVQSRPSLGINFSRSQGVEKVVDKMVVPETVLDTYRVYHDYMFERGLTEDIIDIFDVGYDRKTTSLTFPVKDLEGDVVFVQTRSVRTKFHHYAAGVNKTDYVYGAYEVMKHFPNATEVWVTESIINCLTLWVLGIPAVALMGVGGGKQYNILKTLPYRCYVLALDPDEGGREATSKAIKLLKRNKLLVKLEYLKENLDINDLRDEVLNLEKTMV